MFSANQFYGSSLPEKTLCLTFDDGPGETLGDGPGPKTIRIAEFLKEQNIYATFFMVGKFINQYPEIVKEVAKLDHIIGNHTYNHPDMVQEYNAGKNMVLEIEATHDLLPNINSTETIFFRAPYGAWIAEIGIQLNEDYKQSYRYVGPIYWDILGSDFSFWDRGTSERECADQYIKEIIQKNRGIVLMHDSTADFERMKNNNRTFETIKLLIPELKSMGYKFVRLDEVPGLLR